jgi:predicted small lipoprotein YifL
MSRPSYVPVALAILLALALGACGQQPAGPVSSPPDLTQPTPADADPEDTMPPETIPPAGDVPPALFAQIAAEAAALAGVSVGDLAVDRAESVTWSDGSLGCPQPDQGYTQALVDGYWVVFRANGQELDFRVGGNDQFKLCPPGQGRPPIDL